MATDTYNDITAILGELYDEVNGYDFYCDIFPNNENSGEIHYDYSHPNAIFLYWDEKEQRRLRRVMLKDLWEEDYLTLIDGNTHTLCGGLSYRKTANRLSNAQRMHALIFDLDGVGEHELRNLLHRFTLEAGTLRSLPLPTYLVASGTGVHLYYVFEEPIDLFPNIKVQLKSMKYDLTFKIWEYKATSTEKQIQYQSINQAFRMPGSVNEKHDNVIRAYRVGERVTVNYLNRYVIDPKNTVDLQQRFRPSKMTLEEAKLAYPQWYERFILGGCKDRAKWNIGYRKKLEIKDYSLYEWWLKQIEHVKGGHRYFFLMCMAIYAAKCDLPKAKLKEDMEMVYQQLKQIEHSNPMKREDIKSALEAYDKEYFNFKIADIEKITDIRIERNKRNYQKQADHLEEARAIRDLRMRRQGKEWRNNDGRPKGSKDKKPRKNKQELVQRYRRVWPDGNKTDCARVTGLDPKTIRKWWDT